MDRQEPEFNLVLTGTDCGETDESIQTSGSEIAANERPSYLRKSADRVEEVHRSRRGP